MKACRPLALSMMLLPFTPLAFSQNVGIGTALPQTKLHVVGSIRMVDGNEAAGYVPVSDANGTMVWTDPATLNTGDWHTTGNAGTTSGTHFIGTTDAQHLDFRANSTLFMRLRTDGGLYLDDGANNVLVGEDAGLSIAGGSRNTFIGNTAGFSKTTASGNTAVGNAALYSGNNSNITAVGDSALFANGGNWNSAFGAKALTSNTSGYSNTGLGYHALLDNTTGRRNTAVGTDVLPNNTVGEFNTAMGYYAMRDNTTSSGNTAIGIYALLFQSYANGGSVYNSYNTAVGFQALLNNNPTATNNGDNNTAVGTNALVDNTTGRLNIGVGRDAVQTNTTGNHNVGIGYDALELTNGADANTAVGNLAGDSYNHGNENTFIGYSADADAAGYTNVTAIGARATVGASNTIVLGSINGVNGATSDVNVGIGVTDPDAQLEVAGYTKLGDDAPKIKMKKLTGNCGASQGSFSAVAHGLTSSKIIGCQVLVEYTSGAFIHQGYTNNSGYEFNYYISSTSVHVWITNGNSSNLLNDPFVVLLTYEE